MRAGTAIGGLLTVLTLAAPANVAYAQEQQGKEVSMTLSPRTASPGEEVRITAECATSEATAAALVFDDQTLRKPENSTMVEGTVRVDANAQPGTYVVDVFCANGDFGKADLTVVNNTGSQTGDGASLRGRSTVLTAAGAALLTAAAVGLGAFGRRRRTRSGS
jgi:outer membrane usher protein FimD/PapC